MLYVIMYILKNGDTMRIEYLIKKVRNDKNITLRELSRKTGISSGYLSEIERNEKKPSFYYMILIAKALNVKIEELYKEIR